MHRVRVGRVMVTPRPPPPLPTPSPRCPACSPAQPSSVTTSRSSALAPTAQSPASPTPQSLWPLALPPAPILIRPQGMWHVTTNQRTAFNPLTNRRIPGQPQTNGGPAPGLGLQNNLQEHLQQQKSLPESLSSLKSLAQQALGQSSPPAGYLELGLSQDRKPSSAGSQKNEAHIPPLLGVAPLGIVPLSKEHQFQYR